MIVAIVSVLLVLVALYILFPPVLICGISMYPFLHDGDIVITSRIFNRAKVDQIFIFVPPQSNEEKRFVVKRVIDVTSSGDIFFMGDNAEHSYDSREYGYISRDRLISRYLFTIYRKEKKADDR